MQRFLLMAARLALAAWVGGAALFVVTGVREVTTTEPHLNQSTVKDALVAVRFPAYYAFGFTLTTIALLCVALLPHKRLLWKLRRWTLLGLLAAVLVLMVADYVWIFRPLVEMTTPPGKARPAEFVDYHTASKWINAAGLCISLIAAGLLCWPVRSEERVES